MLRKHYNDLEGSMSKVEKGFMQNEGIPELATRDRYTGVGGTGTDPIKELINAAVETRVAKMQSDIDAKLDRILAEVSGRR